MEIKVTTLITFLIISHSTISQNFEWVGHIGGKSDEIGYSVNTDDSGNIYTAGNFEDTVDFDPSETGIFNLVAHDENVFVQKLDPEGNFIWAKNFGEGYHTTIFQNYTKLSCMTIDDNGNILTAGYFNDSTDFDPSPTGEFFMMGHGISPDAFIHKMDANGNFLWAVGLGNTNDENAFAITTGNAGDIFITGIFAERIDFDPSDEGVFNLDSWSGYDVFILKLNSDGEFIWAKQFGGGEWNDYYIFPFDLKLDYSGNIYITGSFAGTIDVDPSVDGTLSLTANNEDMFIQKLDPDGNLIWAHQTGGTGVERGWSICTSNQGNVYITGEFDDQVDFDPGPGNYIMTSSGSNDIFIQKLDPSGDIIWAKQAGGTSGDIGWDIETDDSENAYIVGSFKGTADADPGPDTLNFFSGGSTDGMLLILDPTGNLINARQLSGEGSNSWYSVAVQASGSICLTGYFKGITDFDPSILGIFNIDTIGSIDSFIQKLSPSLSIQESSTGPMISILPNPFTDYLTLNFNKMEHYIGIVIYNTSGETVYKSTFYNSLSVCLRPNLSPGLYYMTINTQGHRQTIKIINI